MPRILVIGATGYIGGALCESLVRSGSHTVYGLARSEAKGTTLARAEVTPVICPDPVNSPTPYLSLIKSHLIDVVVDAAGLYGDSTKVLHDVRAAAQERLDAYKAARARGPKLGYLYVSGVWVHGSSLDPISDLDPVGTPFAPRPPVPMLAWRPAIEQDIFASSDVLDVAIARPALLYGRAMSLWTMFLAPILEAAKQGNQGEVEIPLEPSSRPAFVHIDDVAAGLHAMVDKIPALGGTAIHPVFALIGGTESMHEVLVAFGRAVGFKGQVKMVGPGGNPLAEAMGASANVDSARAKSLLGWQARKRGFVDGMEVYAGAFVAAMK